MAPKSPYSTALAVGGTRPSHITNLEDLERVSAYWLYSDIFYNVPDAYVSVMRNDEGSEISRRLVPSVRTIIEATNRFLAKDLTFVAEAVEGEPELDQTGKAVAMQAFDNLLTREEFYSKFMALKRWMLIRGDGCFHILADDTKPQGQRIRIMELDPGQYFKIQHPTDPKRTIGAYIVTVTNDDNDQEIVQRQSYLKTEKGIWSQVQFFELTGWDDRYPLSAEDLKPVAPPSRFLEGEEDSALLTGFELPASITSIPIYHFRNNRSDSMDFGTSEVQGLETLFAGINQTASDQDVTVVLTGIGVYTTTSGRPRDAQGNEIDWVIAPASVIELQNPADRFERVTGVGSIQPLLDHTAYLERKALQTSGTPDIAVGVQELGQQRPTSGISLMIQMGPILSKNQEKEVGIKAVMDQMVHDLLVGWLPSYEGVSLPGLVIVSSFGDPLPVDRDAVLAEITAMVTSRLISVEFAQTLVRDKLGYDIPADDMARIVREQQQLLDATGLRAEEEAGFDAPAE